MWSSCRDRKIRIRHNGWRTAGGGKTMTRPTRSRTKGTKATEAATPQPLVDERGRQHPSHQKWKDDTFTEQQIKDYVAGKTVVLANAKDDQGQPCTKYLKFSFEKGRPLTYSQNPDLAQTVAPSNESRTQFAVNNEGKTNEATKHVKEPLQQGQTAPKDETQQKRQTKKSKGMKVS